jgi:cytochrome c-type biogenesis protein CcmH/NrfF
MARLTPIDRGRGPATPQRGAFWAYSTQKAPRRARFRRLAAVISVLVAAAASPVGALAQEPQASLPDIEDEVMCPVCGVTLELAIDAPQAIQEREMIRELIAEGRTKDEIKDALVAEFGEEVLAVPGAEGFDLAAWLVPGAAILTAATAIVIGLRRWRAQTGTPSGSAEPPTEQPLDPAEAKRLDEDLARFDP